MRLDLSVDIASDCATVFSWLAEPERAQRWMTSVASGEILERVPGMVGTTFRERVEDESGGLEMHGRITAFEPDRRISFHLESRVNELDVDYAVEPVAGREGVVRLAMTSNVRWRFPVNVISLFAGRAMKRKILEQSGQEFERLKSICEGTI